jgi:hypothetical protein
MPMHRVDRPHVCGVKFTETGTAAALTHSCYQPQANEKIINRTDRQELTATRAPSSSTSRGTESPVESAPTKRAVTISRQHADAGRDGVQRSS